VTRAAPRRGVTRELARFCWRRRALWLAPALGALALARLLRRAGEPLSAPTVYTLH
jgi:hypothetical protein